MRKYFVAVAVGAMLIASQAAADEVVNVGDQIGAATSIEDGFTGSQTLLVLLFGGLFIGLAAWGLSTGNGNGNPASP